MRRSTNPSNRSELGFAPLRATRPQRLRSTSWIAALALGGAFVLACGGDEQATDRESSQSPDEIAAALVSEGPHDVAVISVKDLGTIRIELLPEIAPETVANFEKLAREGFYAGTTFHRVIPGFMIQGGDPASKNIDPRDDGKGGPGYTISDEFSRFPHLRGVISMANTGYPDSGGSQFFIVHKDAPHLDGKYSAFGRVIEGIEVVDAVTEVAIDKYGRFGPQDRPHPDPVVIESVRIEPAGARAAAGADASTTLGAAASTPLQADAG
jgi:peptidyl-prolyl cis-trans isomerase B (cyclophilin B)